MSATTTITLANRLDEIERVSALVDDFGSSNALAPKVVFDLTLALDELLTNVISYAYDDAREHEITVRLTAEQAYVRIEVEDDGRPFDPRTSAEPDLTAPLELRQVGGLGISLVRKLMTDLRYERRGGHNIVTMTRALEGQEAPMTDAGPKTIEETRERGVVVLRLHGRLDAATAPALEQKLLVLLDAGERRIVVDCATLRYISSAGLRVLLVAAKRAASQDGSIALASLEGQIREVFEIVGFESVFRCWSSAAEAAHALAAESAVKSGPDDSD